MPPYDFTRTPPARHRAFIEAAQPWVRGRAEPKAIARERQRADEEERRKKELKENVLALSQQYLGGTGGESGAGEDGDRAQEDLLEEHWGAMQRQQERPGTAEARVLTKQQQEQQRREAQRRFEATVARQEHATVTQQLQQQEQHMLARRLVQQEQQERIRAQEQQKGWPQFGYSDSGSGSNSSSSGGGDTYNYNNGNSFNMSAGTGAGANFGSGHYDSGISDKSAFNYSSSSPPTLDNSANTRSGTLMNDGIHYSTGNSTPPATPAAPAANSNTGGRGWWFW